MVGLRMLVVIHDMRRQGLTISTIARKTGLDRKTVRKYLERGLVVPAYRPRDPRPRRLGLYSVPDTTRKRVLEVQNHPMEVRIFEAGHLIARHPVLEGRNQRRLDPSHRRPPPPHHASKQSATLTSPRHVAVIQRPLAFYDAVARRMAAEEAHR